MRTKNNVIAVLFLAVVLVIGTMSIEAGKPAPGDSNSLNISRCTQDHSNWCWAGASQSVLGYYGPNVDQCDMANFSFKRSDCCGTNTFDWYHPCNQGNYLFGRKGSCKDVLANWGVSSSGVNGALTWNAVKSEIDGGSPFIMGWYWTYGGGHALTGYGYNVKNNVEYMSYMDPWPGEGFTTSTYSYVVYASDHQWGQTLTTN